MDINRREQMPATLGEEVKGKSYARQEGIIAPDVLSRAKISIIGVGSAGSFITLALAKLGVRSIEVFDNDIVSDTNIPAQFYRIKDIGKPKVVALQELVKEFEDVDIVAHNERYNGQELGGIVISAVDSLSARVFIWSQIKEMGLAHLPGREGPSHYVDTRMGGLTFRIYPVCLFNEPSYARYDKIVMNPKAKDNLMKIRCTERSIVFNILVLAGITADIVVKILKEEPVPSQVIMDLKNLMLVTE